jgi:uncharacterized protein (TIGR02271 family)
METRLNQVQTGWTVYGRDGDKIGDVEEVGTNYVLVTKGLIFVTDIYIPTHAIDSIDADAGAVYLAVEKSAIEDQGWTEPPVADQEQWTGSATGSAATATSTTSTTGYAGETGREYESESDRVRVPLHEEELRAERRTDTAGEVTVGKKVVEEERDFDVPVTHDEVEVRRVPADRRTADTSEAFTEGDTIRVPVSAERVEVTKEPRVVEEIEISKRPVTESQRVSERVRREEVEVDESGNVLTGAGASMTGTGHDLDTGVAGTSGTRSDLDVDEDDTTLRR